MYIKKTASVIGIVIVILAMNVPFAFGASEKSTCVPQGQILELIEKIPKVFPYSEKDNVYTVENKANGHLTVTIEDLKIRFFDSRDSDPKKWNTVSNEFSKTPVDQDLSEIGCVVAGVNYFDSGDVDITKGAIERAQKVFNAHVVFTQNKLKK